MERSGVAAMALGIIERCLELSVKYAEGACAVRPADRRVPADPAEAREDGGRPAQRREPRVPRARVVAGRQVDELSEASAMKLYAAGAATEVALEAVQLFGGNGYMAEYEVEQLRARRQGAPDLRGHRRDPGRPDRTRPPGLTPVEPPPSRWELPDPPELPPRTGRRRGRGRWRPRAGHGARRVPARPVPDARRRNARVVVARSARRDPARRVPRAAARCGASLARFEVRVDTCVRGGDARLRRPAPRRTVGSTSRSSHAYTRLHELGWAHSVETWRDGELVGGLYGAAHRRACSRGSRCSTASTDASKVACWATVELLRLDGASSSTCSGRRRTCGRSARSTSPRAEYLRRSS